MRLVQLTAEAEQTSGPQQSALLELDRLQRQLDELREHLSNSGDSAPSEIDDETILSRLVKEILRSRRRREKVFGGELFGEPAWDILLELYAAEWTRQRLSIHGACCVSAVPDTTALRWIVRLEKEGWVERTDDPLDGRRKWLALTDRASAAMRDYLKDLSIRPV